MENVFEKMTVKALYHHPEHTLAWEYLCGFTYPWEALDGLKQMILSLGATLPKDRYDEVREGVWVAKSATVAPTALICAVGGSSIVASLLFAIQFAEQHLFILQKVESKQKDNYAYNRTENGIHYYDFGCTHSFKGHKH